MRALAGVLLAVAIATAVVEVRSNGVIHISPTTVTVGPGESTASFIIRNEAKTPASFSVSAFSWRMTPANDMELDRTDDVVVYPLRVDVNAGETRRVRVGTKVPADRIERAYRISLEQVATPQPSAGVVAMKMRYSLPLFVQPKTRKASVRLDHVAIEGGEINVMLENLGVVHVTPKRLFATGSDAAGRAIWTRELSAWYLLPGHSRGYRQSLSPEECRRTTTVAAEATFLEGAALTVRSTKPVGRGACARP